MSLNRILNSQMAMGIYEGVAIKNILKKLTDREITFLIRRLRTFRMV